jgi:hypothetical protein
MIKKSQEKVWFWEIGIHYYYNYILKRQQHAEAVFGDSTTMMFKNVKKKYAIQYA